MGKSFDKALKIAKKDKTKSDITDIVDTLKDAPDLGMPTEDFLKAREIVKNKLPSAPASVRYGKLPDFQDLPDFDPSGTATLHKSTNQASKKALDYVSNQQSKGKAFRKLSGILGKNAGKKIGAISKTLGPIGAAIGFASDALASDEAGDVGSEDQQLAQMKHEEMLKRLPPNQRLLMEDIKRKSEELASKPLGQSRLLVAPKEESQVDDIKSMLGEQQSPDREDMAAELRRSAYERMMKDKLGYK